MPVYTLADLKKASGRSEYRKLELPINKNKKIWIPSMEFLYHRIHFNVKRFFPRSKFETIDCCNQNLGEQGKGCPICAKLQEFWDEWKKLKDKEAKKKVTEKINLLVSEELWFNCIDIEDDDKFFQAVRFTMSKGREINNTVEAKDDKDIASIIWYYKKSKDENDKKSKTDYSLQDIDSPELVKIAKELKSESDFLLGRDYNRGGPIDLENAIIRSRTANSIRDILNGGDIEEEEEVDSNISKNKKVETKVDIDESEEISLDDLDGKPEKSEDLDMDGLDLEPVEEVKMKKITPELIDSKAKEKDVNFLKLLSAYGVKKKLIEDSGKLGENIKLLFKVVKEKKEIEIPEIEFTVPF